MYFAKKKTLFKCIFKDVSIFEQKLENLTIAG